MIATAKQKRARKGGLDFPVSANQDAESIVEGIADQLMGGGKGARNGASHRQPPAASRPPLMPEFENLSVHLIKPNPFQPRTEFEGEALQELGESMRANGLVHRIVVRLDPESRGAYQVVAGERRLRAARLIGWREIPAEVRDYTDEQMQALALVENDDRRDINPIERGLAYQKILDTRGLKPVDLERITGRNQSWISNHLRMIKLPEPFRSKVADGTLSMTHARHLLPFAHIKPVMKELGRWLERDEWEIGSHESFRDQIEHAVSTLSKSIDQRRYSSKHNDNLPPMKLTDAELAELDIIELPPPKWNKKAGPDRRALNVKRFDELWAAYEKAWQPKGKGSGIRGQGSVKGKGKQEPTAAELKQQAAERARVFAKRLAAWRANWMRWLIAKRLAVRGVKADDQTMMRVLLWCAIHDRNNFWGQDVLSNADRDDLIDSICSEMVEGSKSRKGRTNSIWTTLLQAEDPHEIADKFTRRLFWDKVDGVEQPIRGLPDDAVLELAEQLQLDLAAEWKAHKAGPLTEAFFHLFDKEKLSAIRAEYGIIRPEAKTKAQLVDQLVGWCAPGPALKLPAELAGDRKKGKKPR